jgi:drug/metabolite transporter (DMT)-like permease
VSKRFFYFIIILSAVLMWSVSFPLIKIILNNGVPPITLAAIRAIVFIPILIYLFLLKKEKIFKITKNDLFLYLSIGLFTIILPGILQNIGMIYTTSSVSSIIQSSGPVFTIILAIILLNESADKNKIFGSIFALVGTIFLVLSIDKNINIYDSSVFGNSLILLSGLSYGISSIITKRALKHKSPLQILGFSSLFGFIVLSLISFFERPFDIIINISIETWFAIFILALFPSFIAILFWYKAMINAEISRLVNFVYLMPVFAVIFSYILIGEIISIQTILFAIMIICGVALAQKNSRK